MTSFWGEFEETFHCQIYSVDFPPHIWQCYLGNLGSKKTFKSKQVVQDEINNSIGPIIVIFSPQTFFKGQYFYRR